MKVTLINFGPYANNSAPVLDPTELAAVFARFSRNNEGIDAILDSVKDVPKGKRTDKIMKMADYGHRSILDMDCIPLVIEDISMYTACRLFSFASLGAGQESSTRYIRDGFNLLPMNNTGLSPLQYEEAQSLHHDWKRAIQGIPDDATREERNKVLDYVRYVLPVIATTNIAMVASAREWTKIITSLLSFPGKFQRNEMQTLGNIIEETISTICGEYVVKHGRFSTAYARKFMGDLQKLDQRFIGGISDISAIEIDSSSVFNKEEKFNNYFDYSFMSFERTNRYDPWPGELDRVILNVNRKPMFAENRDVNRHRNHISSCWDFTYHEGILTLGSATRRFDTMTLSQALYEIEIRTSEGAHEIYRAQYNDLYQELLALIPQSRLRDFIQENMFDNQGVYKENE
jgi:hypothetical protein